MTPTQDKTPEPAPVEREDEEEVRAVDPENIYDADTRAEQVRMLEGSDALNEGVDPTEDGDADEDMAISAQEAPRNLDVGPDKVTRLP